VRSWQDFLELDKGNQREKGGVRVARLGLASWSVLQRERERRKKKRGRNRWFGQILFEF
jgi:hypothetical protein